MREGSRGKDESTEQVHFPEGEDSVGMDRYAQISGLFLDASLELVAVLFEEFDVPGKQRAQGFFHFFFQNQRDLFERFGREAL